TADRNRSHWSTSKTPSYTKSVSWQHHLLDDNVIGMLDCQCLWVFLSNITIKTKQRAILQSNN
ncbi:hypothetical protein, partial [Escherichia coli]|uniref:hypothetical protein n=2 Tax=Escherichia coli TaxID=562 RepID=UPI001B8C16EF